MDKRIGKVGSLILAGMMSCSSHTPKSESDPGFTTAYEPPTQNEYTDPVQLPPQSFGSRSPAASFEVPSASWWVGYNEIKVAGPSLLKKIGRLKRLKQTLEAVKAYPNPTFREMREHAPILTLAAPPVGDSMVNPPVATVIITKDHDVREILDHHSVFTVNNYHLKMIPSMGPFMLASDDSRYNTVEKPWMRKMIPIEDLHKIRLTVRQLVLKAIEEGTLIDKRVGDYYKGRIDIVNRVARRVPVLLTGAYFGFPGPDEATMFRWSKATQWDFFHNIKGESVFHDRGLEAGKEMKEYLHELVKERRVALKTNPNLDDVLSRLIKAEDSGNDILNDDRIVTNIMGTLIGQVETSESAITQSVEQLFKFPAELKEARAAIQSGNNSLFAKYVWEALRFNPVNPFVVRYAEQDYLLAKGTPRQTLIKKGSLMLVSTQSAMFDEEAVKDAMQFRVDRPSTTYFHLGYGEHRCLGDYVSMIQVPEIVKHLIMLPNVRPVSDTFGNLQWSDYELLNQLTTFKDRHTYESKDNFRSSFPERFDLEFDAKGPHQGPRPQLWNSDYAMEAYLNDYNREDFFECLKNRQDTSSPGELGLLASIPVKFFGHYHSTTEKSLLWCRMPVGFRKCVLKHSESRDHFLVTEATDNHRLGFNQCMSEQPLKKAESAFYRNIMLHESIPLSSIPTDQVDSKGHAKAYEEYVNYYERVPYRDCFRNPIGELADPTHADLNTAYKWLYYARLNFEFRLCYGPPVVKNIATHGLAGLTKQASFDRCKNGSVSLRTGYPEGALSKTEQFWFRRVILDEAPDPASYRD